MGNAQPNGLVEVEAVREPHRRRLLRRRQPGLNRGVAREDGGPERLAEGHKREKRRRRNNDGQQEHRPADEKNPGELRAEDDKPPRSNRIKASGRRAKKLQSYSSLTLSKLKSPDHIDDGATTATAPPTTGTGATPTETTAPAAAPTVPSTQTTTSPSADSPSLQPTLAPVDGTDDMALVNSFLVHSQRLQKPAGDMPTSSTEDRDMCLMCERDFIVGGRTFYMLELCGHGYCIECLYRYLQSELAKMESENAPASTDKSEEKEYKAEETDEKGKEKALLIDVQKPSDPQDEEKQAESSNAARDIRCPLSSCGCIVSLGDLKKGFAVFGAQLGALEGGSLVPPSFVSAHTGNDHLKQSQLPSKLSASLRIFIESNECFITCPNATCGVAYERLQPSEDEKKLPVKDDEGKPIVGPALAHYHEFRFRCRVCDTVFCSGCKNIPYHIGYTCQQYQQYGRYKHCIICDMPVKKGEKASVEDDAGKGKEKDVDELSGDENTDGGSMIGLAGIGNLLTRSLEYVEQAEVLDAAPPDVAADAPDGVQLPKLEGDIITQHDLINLLEEHRNEPAIGDESLETAVSVQLLTEEREKQLETSASNAHEVEKQDHKSKGKELADDTDTSSLSESTASIPPNCEERTELEDDQDSSERGAEGLLEKYFSEGKNLLSSSRSSIDDTRSYESIKQPPKASSSDSSVTDSATDSSESETESETGSESPSDSESEDERPPARNPQPPPPEKEELEYEDIYGVDVVEPTPIQAFAKDFPNMPRGIFFWRKRRVRKIRNEIQVEKEAWEQKEKERFDKEQEEYQKQKELYRKHIEAKIEERKEIEDYMLENEWCGEVECRKAIKRRCLRRKECRHHCFGLALEEECLHCLHPECVDGDKQTMDDFCNICYIEGLGAKPCIALAGCGHVFHYECVKRKLEEGWPTAVISFAFMDCPLCNVRMEHPALRKQLKPLLDLEKYIQKAALERIAIEGLQKDEALVNPNSPYYKQPDKYAMDTFAFMMCYRCRSPYYGGKKECANLGGPPGAGAQGGGFNREELICGACSNSTGQTCSLHGEEYMEWKCRFCCKVATYFCAGKAHFCTPCHDVPGERVDFNDWTTLPRYLDSAPKCSGAHECPLGIKHPPNGTEEFCIGCVLCRALNSQQHFTFAGRIVNA